MADSQVFSGVHSQGHLRQLLLGQVQRVVEGHDAVVAGVCTRRQVSSQDGVVHHVHEGRDAVPALVVEPDLRGPIKILSGLASHLHRDQAESLQSFSCSRTCSSWLSQVNSCSCSAVPEGLTHLNVVLCVQTIDEVGQAVKESICSSTLKKPTDG